MTTTGSTAGGAWGPAWVSARACAVMRIEGPDSRRFCNGMFTNNVRDLPVGAANRHAMVDDRGRVAGFLDLLCIADDRFWAVLDEGMSGEAFAERYERYVVFDDVEITDATEAFTVRAVWGAEAAGAAASAGISLPEPGTYRDHADQRVWWSWGWPGPGVRVLVPQHQAESLDGALQAVAEPVGEAMAQTIRVLAGMARVGVDTDHKTLPHELGVRDVTLHFDKGCYLGQETINRVDVMGQVKRRLVGIRIDASFEPTAHDPLHVHADKAMGPLTSPVRLPDGSTLGLALVRASAWAEGTSLHVVQGEQRWEASVVGLPVDPLTLTT